MNSYKIEHEQIDNQIGRCWGGSKGAAMDQLLRRAGSTGDKDSVKRVAQKAGVSESFVHALRGFDIRFKKGIARYGNHETALVLRVLDALDTTLEEFAGRAAAIKQMRAGS